MQFDDLHSKLFALAKKGTQDEHFVISGAPGFNAGRKRIGNKFSVVKKRAPLKGKDYPTSQRAAPNLKSLQFTLFD